MVDTLHPPLKVILTWPTPNYVDPHTRGPALEYLCIILIALGGSISPGLDDALIVFALIFGVALSVLVIIGNRHWWSGHHIWDIPTSKFEGHRLNIWFAEWCYVISTSLTKMSILLFYRRISVTFSKSFIIATWVGIIYNVLYMIAFCLVLLLLCTPISAYWKSFDPTWVQQNPGNHCGKENIELPVSGIFSVIGDLYSALLPMVAIFGLDLPTRQKLSLYSLFSLAFLIVAAGIARTVLMWQMMNENYDFTWVLWEMWIWGLVELYVAILAASAPALKPFLRKFLVEPLETAAVLASSRRGAPGAVRPRRSFHKAGCSHRSRSRRSILASHNGKRDGFSMTKSGISVRESALIDDPEDIGIAYGGGDSFTSKEQWFARELDGQTLETRRYELKQGKEGKITVTQVWGLPAQARPDSGHNRPTSGGRPTGRVGTNIRISHVPVSRPVSVPVPPTVVTTRGRPELPHFPSHGSTGQMEVQVRNFSHPYNYSYTAPSSPTSDQPQRLSWKPPALPKLALPWNSGKSFAAMQLKTF